MEYTEKPEEITFVSEGDAARRLYDEGYKGYDVSYIETLDEGTRVELIEGKLYDMATPNGTHQAILRELLYNITHHIRSKNGKCQVFPAPYAVYVIEDGKHYLEPDISVICDLSKLDKKGCHGAPDWVIEIVSESNASHDYIKKFAKYHEAGVREYWIVDYDRGQVAVCDFEHGAYISTSHQFTETVASHVLEGLVIDFADVMSHVV